MSKPVESVLWYCPDPVLSALAKQVFLTQGIRLKAVAPEEAGRTVGALLGLSGATDGAFPACVIPPEQPVLVLCGFSRARLDALLAALRRAGVPRIDCKAMLTPTNAGWTFRALYEELLREHEAMHPSAPEREK